MASVYLETSFVSACVTSRTDIASLYRKHVSTLWWAQQRTRHEVAIAQEVRKELSHPDYANGKEALALVEGVAVLPVNDDVRRLAGTLVEQRVMPGPAAAGDAIHVAVAAVHQCEYMITWNVRHLANVNKVRHLHQICRQIGYEPPAILTPDLLQEDDA